MRLRRQEVETLLSPAYIDGLDRAPVEEVRTRRDECQRAESVVSYLRRVIQGELDLVIAEMDLRAAGARGDVERLVEELPAILGASRSVPVPRSAAEAVRSDVSSPPSARGWRGDEDAILEDLAGHAFDSEPEGNGQDRPAPLGANLGAFTDQELVELVERMRHDETSLSAQRRQLHERIDFLQAAIIERYKSGAATVDSLLSSERLNPPTSGGGAGDQADWPPQAGRGEPGQAGEGAGT
jgi:hypothetical protein